MNLTFDNLSELDDFLRWADLYHAPGAREPDAPTARERKLFALDTVTGTDCGAPLTDHSDACAKEHERAYSSGDTKPADNPEPAKRKRRTKAETEADAKAAAETPTKSITTTTYTDGTTVTGSGEHPAQSPAQPEGTSGANPFEQAAHTGATTEGATNNDAGTATEPEVVTPFQHLTRAREFIAKHGMPKYNESFSKAGLDANVMAYTGYQRALHLAALDELEKA